MADPLICSKCRKNTWKISVDRGRKTIFWTCSSCGHTGNIAPPSAKEVLQMNPDAIRGYIESVILHCPFESKCKVECTGSWFACYISSKESGISPVGAKVI